MSSSDASTASTVAMAGDWHGSWKHAGPALADIGERGITTVLHAGDFGIWPGPSGRAFLDHVTGRATRYGLTIYVTPGNHEDWSRLLSIEPEQRDELGALLWVSDRVAVFPRDPGGHRFTLAGRAVVSLGGAPSIDFNTRTRGKDWWTEEMIPAETAERVAADGYADIMLTHDSPDAPFQTPRVASICSSNPGGWNRVGRAYAADGRSRLTTAFLGVQPRLLVHGHHHEADEAVVALPDRDHDCRILSLGTGGQVGNVALVDLKTLQPVYV